MLLPSAIASYCVTSLGTQYMGNKNEGLPYQFTGLLNYPFYTAACAAGDVSPQSSLRGRKQRK